MMLADKLTTAQLRNMDQDELDEVPSQIIFIKLEQWKAVLELALDNGARDEVVERFMALVMFFDDQWERYEAWSDESHPDNPNQGPWESSPEEVFYFQDGSEA